MKYMDNRILLYVWKGHFPCILWKIKFHRIHVKKVSIEFGLSGVDEFTQRLEKSDF